MGLEKNIKSFCLDEVLRKVEAFQSSLSSILHGSEVWSGI